MKLALAFPVALFAFVMVGYAHSSPKLGPGEALYTNGFSLAGGCALKVRISGSEVVYIPASAARTEFHGYWPDRVDNPIELASGQPDVVLVGSDSEPDETLTISFRHTPEGIEPVGYVYFNRALNSKNSLAGWHTCSGLRRAL